jgi:hypothetical protein
MRWAFSSRRAMSRGLGTAFLRSPWPAEAAFRFPRWLPDQGRSPGGSPLGGFGTHVPLPAAGPLCRSIARRGAGSLAEASVPPGSPWTEILGPAGFAAPGPKPGPARQQLAEAIFRRWRCADPRIPLSAGQVLDPKVRSQACPVPPARRPWVPDGCFTKPTAFASAKGQARSFRLAAASSAALPFASTCLAARRRPARLPLGLWLENSSSVSGRIASATD